MLTAYRSQFGELDWVGTIRFVAELRPHASTLVEGFGIPDACITAPVAHT